MPDVGVGGLLLGCDIPNFASEFGLACDYVRRVEVVLANRTAVVADESSNAELWWALKGGGPNFGMIIPAEAGHCMTTLSTDSSRWLSYHSTRVAVEV